MATYVANPTDSSRPLDGDYAKVAAQELRALKNYVANIAVAAAGSAGKIKDAIALGAKGDGIADDTAALQAAADLGVPVFIPPGRYRTTQEIVFKDGTMFFSLQAPYFFQSTANTPAVGTVSEIYYDGTGGTNSCVVRMSKAAVGTKPVYMVDESQTLRHAGIKGVLINGNSKAEFGAYAARAGLGNILEDCATTGTLRFGAWLGEMWLARVANVTSLHNKGAGFAAGEDTFGWGGNNINACVFDNVWGYSNGLGLTTWTTADYLKGYGVGLFLGRGCTAVNIDAEHNNGVGIVWSPSSGPTRLSESYTENNCKLGTDQERFQVWYQQTANSLSTEISGVYFLYNVVAPVGNTNAPRIKITGAAISPANKEWFPIIKRLTGGVAIEADFGEYRLENFAAQNTPRFIKHYPQYSDPATITSSQTILYVDDAATGNGSGVDAANCCTIDTAMRIARVLASVTTLNVSAQASTPAAYPVLDGTGFYRNLIIDGATTGRFNAISGTALTLTNWATELTLQNMVVIERCYVNNSRVVFKDNPLLRMDTGSSAGAAVIIDNSNVQFTGSTKIDPSASSAATKIGISVGGNSEVTFSTPVAGTIANTTASHAIDFDDGSGIVRIGTTAAIATWGTSVTYNAGGTSGIVTFEDGIKTKSAGTFK